MDETIKLSRSTVEKYLKCPRCCVLDKKHKIKPPSLPFTLNIAVDNLCKNEFDYYRDRKESHPLFTILKRFHKFLSNVLRLINLKDRGWMRAFLAGLQIP